MVIVGFRLKGIRPVFRRNSSESDQIRIGSGQTLSGSVEFRLKGTRQ
jgi:hypothetical protein